MLSKSDHLTVYLNTHILTIETLRSLNFLTIKTFILKVCLY